MLDREAILAHVDLVVEKVPVPEWGEGECVYVRSLSGPELMDLRELNFDDAKSVGDFLVAVLADENGRQLFRPEDAIPLSEKRAVVVERLVLAAQRLNGMTAKAQEEVAKNSDSELT